MNARNRIPTLILAAATVLAGCRKGGEAPERGEAKAGGAGRERASGASPGTPEGSGAAAAPHVALDGPAAALLGVASEPLAAAEAGVEWPAYGQVLDPTELALLDNEIADAEAAVALDEAQAERARKLFEGDQNVSRRTVETAEALLRADRTRLLAARRKLELGWGASIAAQPGAGRRRWVERLLSRQEALLRVETAAGQAPEGLAPTALVSALGAAPEPARVVSEAAVVDPRTQGRAFLLAADHPGPALRPGAAVEARLAGEAPPKKGLRLPGPAILRHLGRTWVYLEANGGGYDRVEVRLVRPVGDGAWFTDSPLPAAARIVVTGAQGLLSEELKANLSTE